MVPLIELALIVFMIVTMWKVFTKAGRPGWAIIVPIYNWYILLKIASKPGWWLILFFIPLVNIVIIFLTYLAIAQNFGKGTGFAVGLFFLGFIFFPILAFGSAQYNAV
jgi:hypothetical protein